MPPFSVLPGLFLFGLSGFRLLRFTCGSQGDGIFLHIGLVVVLRDAVDAVYQNDSSDGGIQTAVAFFGGWIMPENKNPYLCGFVLYLLLRKATLPDASPRQHKEGVKDEHKNPVFMADLVYTFTGVQTVGSETDTSRYREGKKEGSVNVPFNDSAYISSFDDTAGARRR